VSLVAFDDAKDLLNLTVWSRSSGGLEKLYAGPSQPAQGTQLSLSIDGQESGARCPPGPTMADQEVLWS